MLAISQFRADLDALVRAAQEELERALRGVSDPDVAKAVLQEVLPDLVDVYGSGAGTLSADWYDEARAALDVPGRFRSVAAELPGTSRTDSLAGWAVDPMYSKAPDLAAALTRANGGLQRIIVNAGRDTVTYSAVLDPSARGWQRAGSGECGFCRMLIGRGAVYSEATADFGAHDHCKCVAVPAWEDRPLAVQPYRGTDRNVSDADRARTLEWMRADGLI